MASFGRFTPAVCRFIANKKRLNISVFKLADDPHIWIRIAEQFLDCYDVPYQSKVSLVSYYIEKNVLELMHVDSVFDAEWEDFANTLYDEFRQEKYGFDELRFEEHLRIHNGNLDRMDIEFDLPDNRLLKEDDDSSKLKCQIQDEQQEEEEETSKIDVALQIEEETSEEEITKFQSQSDKNEFAGVRTEKSELIWCDKAQNTVIDRETSSSSEPRFNNPSPTVCSQSKNASAFETEPPDLVDIEPVKQRRFRWSRRCRGLFFSDTFSGDLLTEEIAPSSDMEDLSADFDQDKEDEYGKGYAYLPWIFDNIYIENLNIQAYGPHFEPIFFSFQPKSSHTQAMNMAVQFILTNHPNPPFPQQQLTFQPLYTCHFPPIYPEVATLHVSHSISTLIFSSIDLRTDQSQGGWNANDKLIEKFVYGIPSWSELHMFGEMSGRELCYWKMIFYARAMMNNDSGNMCDESPERIFPSWVPRINGYLEEATNKGDYKNYYKSDFKKPMASSKGFRIARILIIWTDNTIEVLPVVTLLIWLSIKIYVDFMHTRKVKATAKVLLHEKWVSSFCSL